MSRKSTGLLSGLLLAALCAPSTALAQVAPNLLSESPFGIVSSTFTNSNTAPQTIINGQVCFTTGPVTVPLTITGATTTPCPVGTGVDQGNSLAFLNSQACTSLGVGAVALNAAIVGANPPGTFPPGCYSSGGAMDITLGTTVTLSGAGVYIFRPGGALTTGQDSRVVVSGGACESDVFWAPIGATTARRQLGTVTRDRDVCREHPRCRRYHVGTFRKPDGKSSGIWRYGYNGRQYDYGPVLRLCRTRPHAPRVGDDRADGASGAGRLRRRAQTRGLVGIELLHVLEVAESPPHLLDGLHLFEGRVQRIGGGVHGTHRRVTGSLGCQSSVLAGCPRGLRGFPQALPLLPDCLERLPMLVAHFARLLGQPPELLRLIPGRLG